MGRGVSYGSLSALLLLSLLGFTGSDLASDRNECTSQLVGLSPCLPYGQGKAKVPTKTCCDGMKVVVDKSKKCLCILIKDTKDPQLGITINTTLALMIPDACHTPTNITECIDLLHLATNSTEAQIFKQYGETSSPTGTGNLNATKGATGEKNSGSRIGGKMMSWWRLEIAGPWIWCVLSMVIMCG